MLNRRTDALAWLERNREPAATPEANVVCQPHGLNLVREQVVIDDGNP